ncbi:sulfotransferase-like domain-containing protein [Pseudoxanthomonas sp. 10H]|uniref:sulfotransferase-like domain-containing protein n=1 Tax=Pseudoxanthomonas sp. 10H TaxID=3242729 RepID=UPI00355836A6
MNAPVGPIRVAMWSGPRNISTAMMRAWENRGDCAVSDEPLYAHYLAHTGLDHPAREAVIADGQTDWRAVVDALLGPAPGGAPVWYQKHMAHHLLPHVDHGWIAGLRNVLLIRDPRQVVASYVKSRATVTAADIGLPQQVALYEELSAQGRPPPVIDAGDFLHAPEAHLRALCDWLGIGFSARMLAWPKGPRASDGIWAPHWYAHVWESTGFEPPEHRQVELEGEAARVAAECRGPYEQLHSLRLRIVP